MQIDKIISKNKTEVRLKKQEQREYKLVGSMRHKQGLTLFSINRRTLEVKPAMLSVDKIIKWEDAVAMLNNKSYKRKIMIEQDCVYIEALNAENAMKHYRKLYLS